MSDQSTDRDPEIRRRAAWLLGMLGLVAALLVLLMVTFFNNSGGDSDNSDVSLPSDTQSSTSSATSSGSSDASSGTRPSSSDSGAGSSSPSTSGASTTSSSKVSCPTKEPCALDSDVGNALAAINAYRADQQKPPVPGSVSDAAKQCALARGSGCDGGWAETELSTKDGKADGAEAVDKIKQFAKLLSDMKAIEVGWAYDPGSKTLYFATIRQT